MFDYQFEISIISNIPAQRQKKVMNKCGPHTDQEKYPQHDRMDPGAAIPSQPSTSSQLSKCLPVISDSNLTITSYYHIFRISLHHLINLNRVINQIAELKIKNCAKNGKIGNPSQPSFPLIHFRVRVISRLLHTPPTWKMIIQPLHIQIQTTIS